MRETILLVDDEDYIRELVGAILSVEGYRILDADGGPSALEKGRAYDGEIHLLLTDVMMSPMNGGELARLLVPERPEMRVLYISGYPDDATITAGVSQSSVAFLAKPFTPKALVEKIRSVLTEPSTVSSDR